MKKAIMMFVPAIYLLIAVSQDAHAGIAGVITALKGECEAADEKGVQFCSSRENGSIYYLWEGQRYEDYPNQAKGN